MSIKTLALRMPSIVRKARSASFLASASCTLMSSLSIWIDFTNPNEMMSRVKPGYFTDFNAFFTCSSEIDIDKPYVRGARGLGGSASPGMMAQKKSMLLGHDRLLQTSEALMRESHFHADPRILPLPE